MLAFVTSLRHPDNSHDYERVESLLAASLRSWTAQADPRFVVIVVGNRRPRFPLPERVHFTQVDFEPPSTIRGPRTGIPAVLRDKGTKLAVGLLEARVHHPTHVMFSDADDYVSRRLAEFVASRPQEPGWVVTHGWRYNSARRAVRGHAGDFHRQCGTSHIVRADLYPSPHVPAGPTQEELREAFGEDVLERLFGSHMHASEIFPLQPLPFYGALYHVGTGESHSGNGLGGFTRPITQAMAAEFTVPGTGRSPMRLARSFLPSRAAVTNRLRHLLRA